MALDPAIDRLVLCACDASPTPRPALSMWEGTGWASLVAAPPPVVGGTEITDADRGELLLFGPPNTAEPSDHTPVEVWSLTRSTWRELGRSPDSRGYGAVMSAPIDVRERLELCDLLLELGPDAPTLCEGWTTADLAAHLVLREHFHRSSDAQRAVEKSKGLPRWSPDCVPAHR